MESKVYLVKLTNGETLLFRGQYEESLGLLSADATVFCMTTMMTERGPTIVPTPNWLLGTTVNDLKLHVPTHVLYFTDNIPLDLKTFYLSEVTGLVPASAMPSKSSIVLK
jgi:hypothetical protein